MYCICKYNLPNHTFKSCHEFHHMYFIVRLANTVWQNHTFKHCHEFHHMYFIGRLENTVGQKYSKVFLVLLGMRWISMRCHFLLLMILNNMTGMRYDASPIAVKVSFFLPWWKLKLNLYAPFFRLKMKFSCMMELNKYPLDVQVCTMEVASCKTILYFYLFAICDLSPLF